MLITYYAVTAKRNSHMSATEMWNVAKTRTLVRHSLAWTMHYFWH